jgi:hypothetical protein
MKRTLVLAFAGVMVLLSCDKEKPSAVTVAVTGSSAPAPPVPAQPPTAAFVDAPAAAKTFDPCQKIVVAATKGKTTALGETLSPGDLLVVTWPTSIALGGNGTAVVAATPPGGCAIRDLPATVKRIVRATDNPEIVWAGGAMKAHLDVEKDVLADLYVGRLEGTAPVPEHAHPGTWEVLCAIEASGTLTLAGEDKKIVSQTCTVVPPDTKHAWKPDPGSKLVAVQLYSPPGPEQRFKKLAADAASGK